MTNLREAAQMALDTLGKLNKDGWILADFEDEVYASIEALRARLAQPELEPVAWCIVENGRVHGLVKNKPAVMNAEKWQPLYTAPPQREFIGLTDEEREEAIGWSVEHIEAKLKEKNT